MDTPLTTPPIYHVHGSWNVGILFYEMEHPCLGDKKSDINLFMVSMYVLKIYLFITNKL